MRPISWYLNAYMANSPGWRGEYSFGYNGLNMDRNTRKRISRKKIAYTLCYNLFQHDHTDDDMGLVKFVNDARLEALAAKSASSSGSGAGSGSGSNASSDAPAPAEQAVAGATSKGGQATGGVPCSMKYDEHELEAEDIKCSICTKMIEHVMEDEKDRAVNKTEKGNTTAKTKGANDGMTLEEDSNTIALEICELELWNFNMDMMTEGAANMDGGDTKSEMMENAALGSSGSSGSGSGSANALAAAANVRKLPGPECPEEANHVHDVDTCRAFVVEMVDALRNRTLLVSDIMGVSMRPDEGLVAMYTVRLKSGLPRDGQEGLAAVAVAVQLAVAAVAVVVVRGCVYL